ncbi:HPP family protein [Halobacteriaceae archaeon GCM10025711]
MKRAVASSAYAAFLVGVAGALAWATGRPFVFPSLGPTAFVLATVRDGRTLDARRVVGGHAIGVASGLAAYHAIAAGSVLTAPTSAFATAKLGLGAAGVASVALTAGGMLATDTVHPPAVATTLIVSLGLLSTPVEGGIVLVAVAVLYAVHVATPSPALASV